MFCAQPFKKIQTALLGITIILCMNYLQEIFVATRTCQKIELFEERLERNNCYCFCKMKKGMGFRGRDCPVADQKRRVQHAAQSKTNHLKKA